MQPSLNGEWSADYFTFSHLQAHLPQMKKWLFLLITHASQCLNGCQRFKGKLCECYEILSHCVVTVKWDGGCHIHMKGPLKALQGNSADSKRKFTFLKETLWTSHRQAALHTLALIWGEILYCHLFVWGRGSYTFEYTYTIELLFKKKKKKNTFTEKPIGIRTLMSMQLLSFN